MSINATHKKRPMCNVNALLLDMDGVLFDTEGTSISSIISIMKDMGFDVPREFIIKNMGRGQSDLSRAYSDLLGNSFAPEVFWHRYWGDRNTLYSKIGMPVKDGIIELLQEGRKRKIPCVVASSSPKKEVWTSIERAGLGQYIVGAVGGDMFDRCKPEPDIFIVASQIVKVDPSCCLVLEDSLNGLISAHAAGAQVGFIKDTVEYDVKVLAQYCDYMFNSALDVISLLETNS